MASKKFHAFPFGAWPVFTRFALGPLFPTVLAIAILAAVYKEFVLRFRPALDMCNLAILLFGVCCHWFYIIAVFAPLLSLFEAIQ